MAAVTGRPAGADGPDTGATAETRAGIPVVEESVFEGVPVNGTPLFSRERDIAAGRDPRVGSVASAFVCRWDVFAKDGHEQREAAVSAPPMNRPSGN